MLPFRADFRMRFIPRRKPFSLARFGHRTCKVALVALDDEFGRKHRVERKLFPGNHFFHIHFIGEDLRKDLKALDQTLQDASRLLSRVDTEIVPALKTTIEEAHRTLAATERVMKGAEATLVGPNAAGQQELREALSKYVEQLTKNAQNEAPPEGLDQQNQQLSQKDLDQMMKNLDDMMKAGSRAPRSEAAWRSRWRVVALMPSQTSRPSVRAS